MINIEYQLAKKEILYISDINISFLKSSIAVLFCKSINNTKANLQLSFSDVEDYQFSSSEYDFSSGAIEFLFSFEEEDNRFFIKTSVFELVVTTNSAPLLQKIS